MADESDDISILDVLIVLGENIYLMVLLPLGAGVLAVGASFLIAPQFTAITTILPPQQQQTASMAIAAQLGSIGGLGGGLSAALGLKDNNDMYVGVIKSRTVADELLKRFGLRERYGAKYDEEARKELERRTRVIAGKDGLIDVEVDDEDPKRSAEIANAYVEELVKLTQNLAVTEAQQRRLYFQLELKKSSAALANAETALRGSGVSEATLKTLPETALAAIAELRARITGQEVKLASMRTLMTDANPDYRFAVQELAALKAELAKAEESNESKAGGAGAEYITKYRDFKYQEKLYELLAKQYEAARIDEGRSALVIQVLDKAQPAEIKSKPKRALIGIAAMLATLFLVAFFILARQSLRKARNDPATTEKVESFLSLFRRRRI